MKLADRLKDPRLLRNRCYIAGEWLGETAPQIAVNDPATGELLANIPSLGKVETRKAIDAAAIAQKAWAAKPPRSAAASCAACSI